MVYAFLAGLIKIPTPVNFIARSIFFFRNLLSSEDPEVTNYFQISDINPTQARLGVDFNQTLKYWNKNQPVSFQIEFDTEESLNGLIMGGNNDYQNHPLYGQNLEHGDQIIFEIDIEIGYQNINNKIGLYKSEFTQKYAITYDENFN